MRLTLPTSAGGIVGDRTQLVATPENYTPVRGAVACGSHPVSRAGRVGRRRGGLPHNSPHGVCVGGERFVPRTWLGDGVCALTCVWVCVCVRERER